MVWNFKKKEDEIAPRLEDGIFVLKGQMSDGLACELIKGMFEFSGKCPDKTITLYINSEGGSVTAGMAVYDTMRALQNPIRTIGYESVGGISTLLLVAGTKGMREVLQNTRISVGAFFIRADVEHPSGVLYSVVEKVRKEFAIHTGNTDEQIQELIGEKEWLSTEQAIQIGLIDRIYISRRLHLGLFKKLFGAGSVNEIREDGAQQLETILSQEVSTFKNASLWIIGKSVNPKDADGVFILLVDVKFCYVYQVSETSEVLAVSNAFVTSEKELIGFDFKEDGNSLSVHIDSLNGRIDFSVEPMVCSVLGKTKIVRFQGRELMVLKNIIFPNYHAMCKEKELDKNSFIKVDEIVKKLPASVRENIKASIKNGDMPQAIKYLRDATGYGLAEVKEIVERLDFYHLL